MRLATYAERAAFTLIDDCTFGVTVVEPLKERQHATSHAKSHDSNGYEADSSATMHREGGYSGRLEKLFI